MMPRPRPLLAVLCLALTAGLARADVPPPMVFDKAVPENVQDLKAMQAHVKVVVDRVLPCTVGLRIGQAQGSGVIINKEGYVLTAGHVSGGAGRDAQIILHDGRILRGVTLGANNGIDSGLVRITDKGEFPSVEMATSADVRKGQWCVAVGHPGGYQQGRPPVVRVGRVLEANGRSIRTDCTLVGGDSGGPLFDMHGKVIGVHSRIGGSITYNIHVPVDTYRETWDKLAASEVWGNSPFDLFGFGNDRAGQSYLGVRGDADNNLFRVQSVVPESPAEKAGLRADDVILRVDRRDIRTLDDLNGVLRNRRPGTQVSVEVRRGDQSLSMTVTLGKRPA